MARGLCVNCYGREWTAKHPGKQTEYSRRRRAKEKGLTTILSDSTTEPLLQIAIADCRRAQDQLESEIAALAAMVEQLEQAQAALTALLPVAALAHQAKYRRGQQKHLAEARRTLAAIRAILRQAA